MLASETATLIVRDEDIRKNVNVHHYIESTDGVTDIDEIKLCRWNRPTLSRVIETGNIFQCHWKSSGNFTVINSA